MLNLSL
jgi:hypothetical protein